MLSFCRSLYAWAKESFAGVPADVDIELELNAESKLEAAFDAFSRKAGERTQIRLTTAVSSSFDDYFLTAFSNPMYYLASFDESLRPSYGCALFAPDRHAYCAPHTRYFDYRRQLFDTLYSDKSERLWPYHFQAFPAEDAGRVSLAFGFSHIALSWIFFHELAHAMLGHLDFLRQRVPIAPNEGGVGNSVYGCSL